MTTMAERQKRRERKREKEIVLKQKLAGASLVVVGIIVLVLEHDCTILATWSLGGLALMATKKPIM